MRSSWLKDCKQRCRRSPSRGANVTEEPDPPATTSRLSKRERDVLDLVADGLSAQEIAEQVNLSARTVEWHMHQAMKKLGAKNRVQAVVLAIRDGLISV